jgi:nucleoid-associated protein YgaU
MIRSVLALFVFAVALCAYIINAPTRSPAISELPTESVTRARTEALLPNATIPTTPETPQVLAPVAEAAPSAAVATTTATMTQTTANVLSGLGLLIEPVTSDPLAEELANETTNVLSSIGAVTGKEVAPVKTAPSADSTLERLLVVALREGKSDAQIDALVNAAAVAGQVAVPEVLVTADGRVDTAVLLKSIIVQATIAAGGAAPAVPATPTGGSEGVEVRVVQRATEAQQYRFYTVARGDSLGAIAVKFYGDVSHYQVIFEANRGILSSPNLIKSGQRLAIPTLPEV